MKKWHETRMANLSLRLTGTVLLMLGSMAAVSLHERALTTPAHEATPIMMLLAAAVFLSGSSGSVLLFVGPGLWESVPVSERWRRVDGGNRNSRC